MSAADISCGGFSLPFHNTLDAGSNPVPLTVSVVVLEAGKYEVRQDSGHGRQGGVGGTAHRGDGADDIIGLHRIVTDGRNRSHTLKSLS